jgi:redox-sensing transcriptional repressor
MDSEEGPREIPKARELVIREQKVPLPTVQRLSVYRKVLEEMHRDGVEFVYSQQLADMAGVTSAQLRRDLASFGSFGNIVRGYNVYQLSRTMARLLGTDHVQSVALVGVGDLGRAMLSYRGFEERGFHIAVAFDLDAQKIGRVYAGRRCYAMTELEAIVREFSVKIAVLACGPQRLQATVDRLASAGVKLFLNFVPKRVAAPAGGWVEEIDIAARLEKLSFLGQAGVGE